MKTITAVLFMVALSSGCGSDNPNYQNISGNYSGTVNGQNATAIVAQSGSAIVAFVTLADGTHGQLGGYSAGGTLTQAYFNVNPNGPCGAWSVTAADITVADDHLTGNLTGTTGSCGAVTPQLNLAIN